MKLTRFAETALGLVVVAAIATTALVVRLRQAPDAPPAGGAAVPLADVPDVSHADVVLDLGDLRIHVSAGPRPLLAFTRNRFRIRAERGGTPVELGGAVLSFTMTMPMGDHRYELAPAGAGWQQAEAVLPLCPSGKRRWFGRLDFTLEGQARSARFAFDLQPPQRQAGEAGVR